MSSLHEFDLRLPPAKVALSNPESPNTAARLHPVPSVLIARGGAIRTKQDRPVTFALSCDYQGYHSPQIVILSPPLHGKLADRCVIPFLPLQDDSASEDNFPMPPTRIDAEIRCYIPQAGFEGVDAFSYILTDGIASSEPATMQIVVSGENSIPAALPQQVSVKMGESVWIQLQGIDPDNDALEFNIATQPTRGTLRRPAFEDCFCSFVAEQEGIEFPFAPLSNVFIYEPSMDDGDDTAFSDSPLPDMFSFTVTDGTTVSEPANVEIDIRPFNRAPEAVISVKEVIEAWSSADKPVVVANSKLKAEVLFDAGNSIEPDGDPMEVWWSRLVPVETPSSGKRRGMEELPIAQGMKLSIKLPVGKHTIVANVSDGSLEDRCALRVTVLSPAQAIRRLSREVRAAKFAAPLEKQLLTFLRQATKFAAEQKLKEMSGFLDQFRFAMRTIGSREHPSIDVLALADTSDSILSAVEDARSKIIRPASFLR